MTDERHLIIIYCCVAEYIIIAHGHF